MAYQYDFYDYWEGRAQAVLDLADVDADWAQADSYTLWPLSLLNKAFELFYLARQNINLCPDGGQAKRMMKELEEAANAGWGVGDADDLKEAFHHLAKHQGRWKSNKVDTYFGGDAGDLFDYPSVDAPVAAVEFVEEAERKIRGLQKALSNYEQRSADLEQATGSYARRDWDWEGIGKALKELEKKGKEADKLMWWAPPKVKGRFGQVVGFVETLEQIHDGATYAADVYMKWKRNPNDAYVQVAVDAASKALSYVPVLGSFYGKAIYLVIGLEDWFSGIIQQRVDRLDAAAAGRPY